MTTIWEFLLQTLNVSTVALFILIIKRILKDKLSPRWQFGIWSLVLISVLIPAGMSGRFVLINWPHILEMIKIGIFHDYSVIHITLPVALLKVPHTPEEFLFLIYGVGTVVMAMIYLVSYFKLKALVNNGKPAKEEVLQLVSDTAHNADLPVCPVKMVKGIRSAFIFGVVHPVLVLPEGEEVQELVILHELLHYRHKDTVWSVVIAAARCLHWCNPFLWYCCDEAGNDLESLCDQRVLERLEGEQRRDYGKILLSMVNEKYAGTAGTTSVANGGKNIRKRIEAIVRFKHYPKGMQLVSVCIILILGFPLCVGAKGQVQSALHEIYSNGMEANRMLAMARTQFCSTPEGALDAYAKAVLTQCTSYRILCAPKQEHRELLENRERNYKATGLGTYTTGLKRAAAIPEGYSIMNPLQLEDGSIQALVVVKLVPDAAGNETELALQTVRVEKQEGRWTVLPVDQFRYIQVGPEDMSFSGVYRPEFSLLYTAETELFNIELNYQIRFYRSDKELPVWDNWFQENDEVYDPVPVTDLRFDISSVLVDVEGIFTGSEEQKKELKQIDVVIRPMENETDTELPSLSSEFQTESISSSGLNMKHIEVPLEWKDRLILNRYGYKEIEKSLVHRYPAGFAMDLYINDEKVDSLILTMQKR